MKQKNFLRLLFLTLYIVILSSCGQSTSLPSGEYPDIGIPIEEINSRFNISINKESENSFKNKDWLYFFVNLTQYDYSIAFDAYTYVRIYTKENDKWIEIPYEYYVNETGDPQVHSWLFNLDAKQPSIFGISYQAILPDIPDLKKPMWFRIFLIGSLNENNTILDKKTAAYMDVLLKP